MPERSPNTTPISHPGKTIGHLKKDKRSKTRKQADFLAHFSIYASVLRACKKAKVPRSNVYLWINEDEAFKPLYQAAVDQALGALEDEAVRRAHEGVIKPIFQGGKKVGSVREYSDTLMIVLLKARAPEKYKDRSFKEVGGTGVPIKSELKVTVVHTDVPIAESEDDIS